MIQNDQIAIANIEARQMIARIFGIENVFVDDVRSSARFGRSSTLNKKKEIIKNQEKERKEKVQEEFENYILICRMAPYLPNMSYISSDEIL